MLLVACGFLLCTVAVVWYGPRYVRQLAEQGYVTEHSERLQDDEALSRHVRFVGPMVYDGEVQAPDLWHRPTG